MTTVGPTRGNSLLAGVWLGARRPPTSSWPWCLPSPNTVQVMVLGGGVSSFLLKEEYKYQGLPSVR